MWQNANILGDFILLYFQDNFGTWLIPINPFPPPRRIPKTFSDIFHWEYFSLALGCLFFNYICFRTAIFFGLNLIPSTISAKPLELVAFVQQEPSVKNVQNIYNDQKVIFFNL